jgi:uncharacterized integral membrane protein
VPTEHVHPGYGAAAARRPARIPLAIMFHQVVAAVDSHARLRQLAWSIPAGLVAFTRRVAAALVIVVARKPRLANARGDLW